MNKARVLTSINAKHVRNTNKTFLITWRFTIQLLSTCIITSLAIKPLLRMSHEYQYLTKILLNLNVENVALGQCYL